MDDLATWQRAGFFNAVDVQLARLLGRLSGDRSWEFILGAALASQWVQRGQVCVDIELLAGQDLSDWIEIPRVGRRFLLPERDVWIKTLKESPVVGNGDQKKPLILRGDRYLYMYRYWAYERQLAERIDQLNEIAPVAEVNSEPLHEQIEKLFAKKVDRIDEDDQMNAARKAMEHRLLILTGGPGTGKTTTVLRLMTLILLHHKNARIALAAPTGKAAMRLEESILKGLGDLPVNDALRGAIPSGAQTIHRLLGYQKGKTAFRHGVNHPLPYDVVIVDEASMLDLALGAKLMQALSPRTRLILVGDRDQLPSVDAGALFSDLASEQSPVAMIELRKNYRFSQSEGIGGLATAIRSGDEAKIEQVFDSTDADTLAIRDLPALRELRNLIWQKIRDYQEGLRLEGDAVGEVFERMERFRILCAHRIGPYGAEAINAMIESLLVEHRVIDGATRWYAGRTILITENDYSSGLFNGDTGVILPWNGKLSVAFRSGQDSFRFVSPARLPVHESAYAMTVHKSQGSEFDEVLMILSDQPSRLMTRELLYTGVTRARRRVEIWGSREQVALCAKTALIRMTGIKEYWR